MNNSTDRRVSRAKGGGGVTGSSQGDQASNSSTG